MKEIKIPMSEKECQEIMEGKEFHWVFDGIKVHLFSEKEPVVFLKDKDDNSGNGVFAFFPELVFGHADEASRTSYAHVGQHSACNIVYAFECERAKKEEYIPLKKELDELGYNLEILNGE